MRMTGEAGWNRAFFEFPYDDGTNAIVSWSKESVVSTGCRECPAARRPWRMSLAAACLLAALAACETVEFAPPGDDVRGRLGEVAVVSLPLAVRGPIADPVKGAGAGMMSGAGQGALGSLAVGASVCYSGHPYGCAAGVALGIVLALPAAIVGGIVGASVAHPAEEVDMATVALRGALDGATPSSEIARYMVELRGPRVAPVLHLGNGAPDRASVGYDALAKQGLASVVELVVTRLELNVIGNIDPDVSLQVTVRARLLRAADGVELYRRVWLYWGPESNYFDAAADDAAPLRAGIDVANRALAARIVDDLFHKVTPEPKTEPAQGRIVTLEAPIVEPDP